MSTTIWEKKDESFEVLKYRQTKDASWLKEVKPRFYPMKDFIPFMVTPLGELVCLPKTKDMPSFGIFGSKRTGKTNLLANFMSTGFWSMGWNILHANDMTRETFTWQKRFGWEKQTNVWENRSIPYWTFRRPKYLPIVHVLFATTDLRIPEVKPLSKWITSLPFSELLEDPEGYLGMEKMSSASYLANMKSVLMKEKNLTLERIETVIKDYVSENLDAKLIKVIVPAIMSRIQRLYNDGILDISNKDSSPTMRIKTPADHDFQEYNVLTGIMMTGGIPILHTDNILKHDRFFRNYLASQLKKVVDDQIGHPALKNKRLSIFIDEITTISHSGKNGENPIIQQLVAQGGPMGIGTFYCTQNPSRLDPRIKSNTKYFVTCANTTTEARVLIKDFGLEDRHVDEIANLDKNYRECFAYTTEKFAVFNPLENEYYEDNGPFVGEYIMPTCGVVPPKT